MENEEQLAVVIKKTLELFEDFESRGLDPLLCIYGCMSITVSTALKSAPSREAVQKVLTAAAKSGDKMAKDFMDSGVENEG